MMLDLEDIQECLHHMDKDLLLLKKIGKEDQITFKSIYLIGVLLCLNQFLENKNKNKNIDNLYSL